MKKNQLKLKSNQNDESLTSWDSLDKIMKWARAGNMKYKLMNKKELIVYAIPETKWSPDKNADGLSLLGITEVDCLYRQTNEGITIIDLDHVKTL